MIPISENSQRQGERSETDGRKQGSFQGPTKGLYQVGPENRRTHCIFQLHHPQVPFLVVNLDHELPNARFRLDLLPQTYSRMFLFLSL